MSHPNKLSNEKNLFTNKNVASNFIHAILPERYTSNKENSSISGINRGTITLVSTKAPNNSFNESIANRTSISSNRSLKSQDVISFGEK